MKPRRLIGVERGIENEQVAAGDDREHWYSVGRMLAVSDGVFAFALTLLVVQLTVPDNEKPGALGPALLAQAPSYFSYALSFAVIAITWYGHHENFKYFERSDGRLIALNFCVLLLVAFLPFPTAVLGHNGSDSIAPLTYAVTIAALGIAQAATWVYATNGRRLTRRNLARDIVRDRLVHSLTVPAVFLVSIPIAVWWPTVEEISWSVLWIAYFLVLRRFVDRIIRRL